jgi:hypothetical protein
MRIPFGKIFKILKKALKDGGQKTRFAKVQ